MLVCFFKEKTPQRAAGSHQSDDALVSQFVLQDHDGVLGAAARRSAHSQRHLLAPGDEAERARAVGPQAPHTAAAARTVGEGRGRRRHKLQGGEVNLEDEPANPPNHHKSRP